MIDKTRQLLAKLPGGLLTLLTVILILWLTLSPDPLGDDAPRLFEGADKVVHALMFGFLSVMAMLDVQRHDKWRPLTVRTVWICALGSTALGVAVEFAQRAMNMGRGFDVGDMVADALGTVLCASFWLAWQLHWSVNR